MIGRGALPMRGSADVGCCLSPPRSGGRVTPRLTPRLTRCGCPCARHVIRSRVQLVFCMCAHFVSHGVASSLWRVQLTSPPVCTRSTVTQLGRLFCAFWWARQVLSCVFVRALGWTRTDIGTRNLGTHPSVGPSLAHAQAGARTPAWCGGSFFRP